MTSLALLLRDLEQSGSRSRFLATLDTLAIPTDVRTGLARAVDGDHDEINRLLFRPSGEAAQFVWLARVRGDRFAWMLGEMDPVEHMVRDIRDRVLAGRGLACSITRPPPPARFVNVHASSSWQKAGTPLSDDGSESFAQDMAIFQTTYHGTAPREDVDQMFCINMPFLAANTEVAYRRASLYLADVSPWSTTLLARARLLSALHIELHNIGHFCGPFPFHQASKGRLIYQSVEEFRACLAAIQLLDEADVDAALKQTFLLHVIIVRCFLYAYRAMRATEKNAALVREVIVGCMFAKAFLAQTESGLMIKPRSVRELLIEIHELEALAKVGAIDLGAIAGQLLARTFANGEMDAISASLYSFPNSAEPASE